MNIRERLRNTHSLSANEQTLAEYLLKHTTEAVEMDYRQLSEQCHVSISCIFRLCRKMEVKGFNELKLLLSKELNEELSQYQNVDFSVPFSSDDSLESLTANIANIYKQTVDDTLRMLGAEKMTLNRLLFDREASSRGIENYITAREAGLLLKRLYDGEAVSGPASEDMLSILKDQRLNGKIPFLLPHSVKIAHKTGEDDGITHDVGIVYARQPFIVCFCGEHVSPPEFERAMQDITLMLYENAERIR